MLFQEVVSSVHEDVVDILEGIDWNIKGIRPFEIRRVIEIKSDLIRIKEKLEKLSEEYNG